MLPKWMSCYDIQSHIVYNGMAPETCVDEKGMTISVDKRRLVTIIIF